MSETSEKSNDKSGSSTIKPKKVVPPQLVRGMHDILPAEWQYWDFVLKAVNAQAYAYSFDRIETPVLEKTNLFTRAIGTTTDIVEKEMFSFVDQSGDHLTVRPEYTAGIARAYIEHGMISLPKPIKLFALGPIFRHERPQAGRLRQFWQFDFEILGETSAAADSQLIVLAAAFFESLGLQVSIQINTVGCGVCRPVYRETLINYFKSKRSQLCEDCKRRLTKNPLRVLDCKVETCRALTEHAPQIVDSVCEECRLHFMRVLECLDEVELEYQLNSRLVRGLDYYTRTVFEIWNKADSGNSALVAGGRYDTLIAELGGQPTPAVGFAGGIERVILELKNQGAQVPSPPSPDVFVACLGEAAHKKALKLFEELRKQGIKVAESFTKDGLKSQLEVANKLKVKLALVLGQKELMDGTIIVRDMENGIQEIIDMRKVAQEVEKRLVALRSS